MGMILGNHEWVEYGFGLGEDGVVRNENGFEVSPLDDDYYYYKHLNDD